MHSERLVAIQRLRTSLVVGEKGIRKHLPLRPQQEFLGPFNASSGSHPARRPPCRRSFPGLL